ncbi:MAG: hypothetical protein CMC07_03790 [Flavobacteriaceae bacterium]|nr:hypothetical protein [Flavobacteriaceae bacterium]
MDNKKILSRISDIEAHIDLIKQYVTVLKSELADSGTSKSSTRKGVISDKQKVKILAKRRKSRMKKE